MVLSFCQTSKTRVESTPTIRNVWVSSWRVSPCIHVSVEPFLRTPYWRSLAPSFLTWRMTPVAPAGTNAETSTSTQAFMPAGLTSGGGSSVK